MRDLMQLARRQHALFTTEQWLACGLGRRALQSREASGEVIRVHHGVYRFAAAPALFPQVVRAACLAVDGVAAGRCAGHFWGMRRFEPKVVEILVERAHTPRLGGVVVRRTDRLPPGERTTVGGIPVTTRARTLLDLAALAPARVEGALNGVLLANPSELKRIDRLLRGAHPKRRGVRELRRLVEPFLCGRRPTESVLEDDFLAVLRQFGLPEPVPQHEVGNHRLDFAYPERLTGFELQSLLAHAEKEDIERNCAKANALLDWTIAYFTWDDVHGKPGHVAATVQALLRRPALAAA